MSWYSQNDPRWRNLIFGLNTDPSGTFGAFACLTTVFANFMTENGDDTTPLVVNNQFKVNGGFVPGTGIMYWSAPLKLNPAIQDHGFNSNLAQVNQWLSQAPNFAALEVKNRAGGQHYVYGHKVNTIIDSLDGVQKNILTYPFVTARLYSWIEPGKGSETIAPVINGDEQVIADTDNEFARANDVFIRIRGRALSRPEFQKNIVGLTWLHMLEVLTDGSQEAIDTEHAQEVGQLALRDDWQGQIMGLTAKTNVLQNTIDELKAQADKLAPPTVTAIATISVPFSLPETPNQQTLVAATDGEMVDAEGKLPNLLFKSGTVFHMYSTFANAGKIWVRTQKSKDNSQWYGTDVTVFPLYNPVSPSLTAGDTIQLGASKIFGTLSKLWHSILKL